MRDYCSDQHRESIGHLGSVHFLFAREYCAQAQVFARRPGVFCFSLTMPPKLLKETKDTEASASRPATDGFQIAFLQKVAALCDSITQRLGVQQAREPELRRQLLVAVYTGYKDTKSFDDFSGELDTYKVVSDASESLTSKIIFPRVLK